MTPEGFLNKVVQIFREFQTELENLKKAQPDISDDDIVRSDIDKLFDNKIGFPLTNDELKNLYEQGKDRYEQHRPPGYFDKGKSKQDDQFFFAGDLVINREYGDLIIWFQIIKEAMTQKVKHIIFITDDDKGDWWWTYKGKTIGARPELVEEIKQKARAKSFYMYNSASFLKYAKEFLGADINQETINQVREISELQKVQISRLQLTRARLEQVEYFVYKWLQSRYFENSEVTRNDGFPDFTLIKDNKRVAFEIKYIRDIRNIFHRWRELMYRGFYEISQGKFDVFYIVFVIDHDRNTEFQRWVRNLETPKGVKILFFEVFTNDDGNVFDLHFIREFSDN